MVYILSSGEIEMQSILSLIKIITNTIESITVWIFKLMDAYAHKQGDII